MKIKTMSNPYSGMYIQHFISFKKTLVPSLPSLLSPTQPNMCSAYGFDAAGEAEAVESATSNGQKELFGPQTAPLRKHHQTVHLRAQVKGGTCNSIHKSDTRHICYFILIFTFLERMYYLVIFLVIKSMLDRKNQRSTAIKPHRRDTTILSSFDFLAYPHKPHHTCATSNLLVG